MPETPLDKTSLLAALPIVDRELAIRPWRRMDIDRRAEWPPYPEPYRGFNFPARSLSPAQRDLWFAERDSLPDRLNLTVDHPDQLCIAYFALTEIDFAARAVGNMGIRVAPHFCSRGLGTRALRRIVDWAFAAGLQTIRLDVAASNRRAVRSYEKAGFAITGEFWRDDHALRAVNLADPRHDDLRPHVRFDPDPQLRFWWMQVRR